MTVQVRKMRPKGEGRDVEEEQEKRTGLSIIHTLLLHLEQNHWPNWTQISSARDHKEKKGS